MNDLLAVTDRVEIEALRGEFTDAGMMRDYDRLASLFTEDGEWRIPDADVAYAGRAQIRAGVERMRGFWEYFVQTVHPGTIRLAGDTATGRAYVAEFGRMRDGSSHANHALYHDRYERTPDGWRFAARVYEIVYFDATPLPGRGRHTGDSATPLIGHDLPGAEPEHVLPGHDGLV